jgi:hypothetical protein
MCTPSEQISQLSTWCDTNGIKIDPRLEIRHTEHSGVSVFAARDINVSETRQSSAGNMPTHSETESSSCADTKDRRSFRQVLFVVQLDLAGTIRT